MNHILEIILFVVLFALVIYLFLVIVGTYQLIQEDISNSELKMNDQINVLKNEISKLKKDN
jgi:predicted PurR-regulated permease PerM